MKDNVVYLRHMLDAVNKIARYVNGVSFETFKNNDMMVDAVVRELEIIGEAASKIDLKFRVQNTDVPWKKIVGMRNYLIHEYFGVSKKIVWETCQSELPELKKQILSAI